MINQWIKKCFGAQRKLDPEQIDAEHLSALDSLILSSKNKHPNRNVNGNNVSNARNLGDNDLDAPFFDDFADLMSESFTKKTTERQEMERRFGQPLL